MLVLLIRDTNNFGDTMIALGGKLKKNIVIFYISDCQLSID